MENKENTIYFITGNNNKFMEVKDIFKSEDVRFNLREKNLMPIEIQAESVREVALYKLNSVRNKVKESFFIEDAGFFVDKPLKGFPGVYSSYIFKTIGNEGVLKLINNFNQTKAHFSAVFALYLKPLEKIFLFEGNVNGKISEKVIGEGGFGFDPIFIPDAIPDRTFAELSMEEKNNISHRGQALRLLIKFLKEN